MNSGGGYSIPKENEFQNMNRWVPATPNKATSSNAGSIPIQLQGSNFETANWQQLLEFPNYQPLGSVGLYQPVKDLNPYRQADRNGGPLGSASSYQPIQDLNSYRQADRNGGPLGSVSSYQPVLDLNPYRQADGNGGPLGSVSSYQPVQDLNPYRQVDRNGGPLGSVSSYQPVQDLNPYRQDDRNGGPLGSVSSYQPAQDLNSYQQADRNGGHISNPNSFMALLGFDDSYNIGDPLLDDNQGTHRVSQGYPSMHDYISKGNDTLGSNRASVNPPWMAPQFLAQHRSFQTVNRPVIPNLNVQASVDWIDNHSAAMPMMEQNHHLASSECTASKDVFQLPEDQFLAPSRLEYNLNLPARTETEASFSQTPEFFHHTSATLNQAAKSLENKQSEILQLPEPERRLSLSGEKQIRLTENGTQQSSELQQTIVDTSSRIISTPEKILANEKDEGQVQVIDMDQTPQHKTPKRRKHRPKVIREGKPKKASKSEKPKNPERPKRKYTRKSSLNAPEIQPSEVIEGTGGSTGATATKSCKRALSFEQQKSAEQTEENSNTQPELVHQKSMVGFDLNLDNQATEICYADNNIFQRDSVVQISGQNELLSRIHPAPVKNTLTHSIPQGPTISSPHSVRAPPIRTTTFQDLLMGNNNSAGNLAAAAKANINPNSQAHAMYSTETYMGEAQRAQQRKQNELQTLYQQTSTTCNFNNLMPQQRTNISSHTVRHPPIKAATFQELLMENEKCAQRTVSSQMVNLNQNNWRSCYNPVQRFTSAENTGQLALQAKNSHDNVVKCGQMTLYRSTQPVMITSDGVQGEARKSKRERDFISEPHRLHGITSMNSSLTNRMMENGYKGGYATRQELPEAEKKRRIENMPYVEISGPQNQCLTEIKSGPLQANIGKNDHLNTRPSHFNPYPWLSYPTNISHYAEFLGAERVGNRVSTSSAAFAHSSRQHTSSEQPSYISQSHRRGTLVNVQVSPSPVPTSGRNLQLVPTNAFLLNSQQTVGNSDTTITARQYSRPTASGLLVKTVRREVPCGDMQAITTVAKAKGAARPSFSSRKQGNHNQQPSSIRRGQLRKIDIRDLIDDIIYQMEHLKLENVSEDILVRPENAIVPYKGDGPVVMYQAKKRKPRPKVDLDPESERIWKLLMGKEGPTEGTDTDKEKWWEEERTVFRLRANSFIARMHLVQGDRRFSKWKGSVVDSVIGVFLTQNVSDHLSSSAFMSLAARFPLSLSSRASCTDDDAIVEEEPEICIIDLEDEIPNIDAKHTISSGNSMASENEEKITTSGTEIVSSLDGHIRGGNNGTLSLDSFDSSICLTNKGSCSGSNSEVEEQLSNPNPSRVHRTDEPTELIHVSSRDSPLESPVRSFHHSENAQQTTFPSCDYQLHLQLNSIQGASEKDCQRLSGGESMSSFPACDASECSSNTSDLKLQNRKILTQNGHPREKTELRPNLNEQLGSHAQHQEGILTTTPIKETTQHPCIDHHHESLTSHSDQTSAIEEVTEPISREQGLSNAANINIKGSSPKNRKGKQDTDKKLVDWDILRKEAQLKNSRSRNKDAMDSMDYETMRHANVKEISDAIKERGMNNMLAERIKDFLNRLVTDHGSIDLEWLRDAPPDKAKDYLLSIRGLGLKSVECVRLLTLHHLAFPVDTNVGRIAVRLGWVPLQPLPESLQLHLLELYPVLETIQKYLWPRLCKLDQRTLYELHYQMITFGKVFCTKSKPNCNACPMRAECRHFASAFASARLALPGPEEKNIVPSWVSVPSDRNPATDTPSRPLLEWDNQLLGVERLTKANCEPIVEEPTTPVQEPEEVSELDIEDSFGEDPDEIPTIKLDFQEFTQNLQCYMQENNLDIQNGGMSKALVALTAEAASLPPQKLKNVSRLRTEHQVYELPDSHPLLKEMDKREPDDPSPYLLAIWTPGETAISTQLPESQCQSDDPSKMCSEKTCFSCNSRREADSNIVRGTLLIPCRTAMRGSFPLNGTYFQVNEMFADHESSMNPIDVPREWIWNLPRRTVYFGTSVSTIFKGLSTEGIQFCFWRGFVCVRGFDQRYRAPRPLLARLHHPASKLVKKSKEEKK